MPKRNLHRQVRGLIQQKSDKLNLISGELGITINGQRTVEVSSRDGYVWVRLRGSQSELIQAYNASVSPIYDLPVLVIRTGNKYSVYGRDIERYDNWGVTPYLPKHGTQHSFAPELGMGGDVAWVYSRQFVPMLASPSGSAGAGGLVINPYVYRSPSDGSWKYIGDTGTDNALVAKPTDNQARMMLLYWDLDTNDSAMLTGTLFASSITGTSAVLPYIPTTTDQNKIPLVGIRLVSGTTTLGWDNVYDVRQFAVNTPRPFEGGFFSIWDEGVPKGTGTILDFVGVNVDASLSGTVARIFVTGSVGGAFSVWDEGVPKGTGTTFDFVGTNVNASVSGSVVRIFITGSTGGGQLSLQDEGIVLGNINTINVVGANASASISGTSGQISIPIISHQERFFTSGSAGIGSIAAILGSGDDATGNFSFAIGSANLAGGASSFAAGASNEAAGGMSAVIAGSLNTVTGTYSSIIAGTGHYLTASRSSIISGQGITGSVVDTAYSDRLNLKRLYPDSPIANVGISSQGFLVTGSVTEASITLADNTTNNASTTKHGFLLKATAPSSGIRNVVAIDNAETVYKNIALLDNNNPAAIGTVSPGTSLVAARRDHVHAADHVNLANKGTNTHATIDTHLAADTKHSQIFHYHNLGNTIPASTTYYLIPGVQTLQSSFGGGYFPRAGTIKNLFVRLNSAQPASGTLVITVRVNNVATAITVTVPISGAAGFYTDYVHTAALAAEDYITVYFVNNATGASGQITSIAFDIEWS